MFPRVPVWDPQGVLVRTASAGCPLGGYRTPREQPVFLQGLDEWPQGSSGAPVEDPKGDPSEDLKSTDEVLCTPRGVAGLSSSLLSLGMNRQLEGVAKDGYASSLEGGRPHRVVCDTLIPWKRQCSHLLVLPVGMGQHILGVCPGCTLFTLNAVHLGMDLTWFEEGTPSGICLHICCIPSSCLEVRCVPSR